MEQKSLCTLVVGHLTNNNAYSLFKSTVDIAVPVRTQIGPLADSVLTALEPEVDIFGQNLNAQFKSEYTGLIKSLDTKNDALFAEIKRTVIFMAQSRDSEKKVAAETLNFFFSPYWAISKMPIKTQADNFEGMFEKFAANAQLIGAAASIAVDGLLTELESSNAEIIKVYIDRNEVVGGRGASSSSLRPAASERYADFCTVVEQTVSYMPSDELITLFNNMDELRKKSALLTSKSN